MRMVVESGYGLTMIEVDDVSSIASHCTVAIHVRSRWVFCQQATPRLIRAVFETVPVRRPKALLALCRLTWITKVSGGLAENTAFWSVS